MIFYISMVLNIIWLALFLAQATRYERLIKAQRKYIEALEKSERVKSEYINLLELKN